MSVIPTLGRLKLENHTCLRMGERVLDRMREHSDRSLLSRALERVFTCRGDGHQGQSTSDGKGMEEESQSVQICFGGRARTVWGLWVVVKRGWGTA